MHVFVLREGDGTYYMRLGGGVLLAYKNWYLSVYLSCKCLSSHNIVTFVGYQLRGIELKLGELLMMNCLVLSLDGKSVDQTAVWVYY